MITKFSDFLTESWLLTANNKNIEPKSSAWPAMLYTTSAWMGWAVKIIAESAGIKKFGFSNSKWHWSLSRLVRNDTNVKNLKTKHELIEVKKMENVWNSAIEFENISFCNLKHNTAIGR